MTAAPPLGEHRLCSGRVWHVRKQPFRHAFDYRVQMLELDLDDLDSAFARNRLWSLDQPNLGSFRRRDHLDGARDLAGRARAAVAERVGFRPDGAVHLISYPRYFGYAFNPVTFYLFHPPEGARCDAADADPSRPALASAARPISSHAHHGLDAILLEVSNTPWNDRHVYALDCRSRQGPWVFDLDKAFHVSPFLPMDMRYRFRFELDETRFRVTKENLQDDASIFIARMDLKREPLTTAALNQALRAFPPMTMQVIGAIYWQALRLWLRGARYHPRPATGGKTPRNG